MKIKLIPASFRLDEDTLKRLKEVSEYLRLSQTRVVNIALTNYFRAIDKSRIYIP